MKLVASSKLKAIEEALGRGRAFGESILNAIALKEDNSTATQAKGDEDATLNIFVDQAGAKVRPPTRWRRAAAAASGVPARGAGTCASRGNSGTGARPLGPRPHRLAPLQRDRPPLPPVKVPLAPRTHTPVPHTTPSRPPHHPSPPCSPPSTWLW